MPNRIIREGWLESEPINTLDPQAECFFLRLCLRADDFGRYHANPVLMKSALFPLRENVRSTDIPRWIAACEKAGLLRCYSDSEAKKYVEIIKFGQRTRAEKSKFPTPTPANDGHPRASDGHPHANDGPPRTYSDTESETETHSESGGPPAGGTSDPEADEIYQFYPKKSGKQAALVEIKRAMKKTAPTVLLDRVKAYALAVSRWPQDDLHFVPDPERWFKKGRYDDDPSTWERRAAPSQPKPDRINFTHADYTGFST